MIFDYGHYGPNLDKALELSKHEELLAEQARRAATDDEPLLGIGMCTYVEICGLAPSRALGGLNYGAGGWEHATVRLLPTGKVEVVSVRHPMVKGTKRRGLRSLRRRWVFRPTTSSSCTLTPR